MWKSITKINNHMVSYLVDVLLWCWVCVAYSVPQRWLDNIMILLCCPLQKLLTKAHRKGVLQNVCSQNTKATGDIPLHLAVFKGDKSAVEMLLPGPSQRNTVDCKDYICVPNNHAKTPVHIAAEGNHHEWVLTVYTGIIFVYVLANTEVFTVGAHSESYSAPVKISHAWSICTWTLALSDIQTAYTVVPCPNYVHRSRYM